MPVLNLDIYEEKKTKTFQACAINRTLIARAQTVGILRLASPRVIW